MRKFAFLLLITTIMMVAVSSCTSTTKVGVVKRSYQSSEGMFFTEFYSEGSSRLNVDSKSGVFAPQMRIETYEYETGDGKIVGGILPQKDSSDSFALVTPFQPMSNHWECVQMIQWYWQSQLKPKPGASRKEFAKFFCQFWGSHGWILADTANYPDRVVLHYIDRSPIMEISLYSNSSGPVKNGLQIITLADDAGQIMKYFSSEDYDWVDRNGVIRIRMHQYTPLGGFNPGAKGVEVGTIQY